ncbi:hypothetical protein PC117_g14687 [Phytophthora cactorum]|uniref:PiggyBac transposable element-derived protein domain-containing protein n=1 Tax=Phytophthora cactorum TaxID=29920 RepID=A0A8T1CLK8_9STRA|nr:hypothetical protein PC117_g14687 [Phytophthora cactorum]
MAEAPGQKRKYGKAPGARKRRRVRSSLEGAPTETTSALGGVAIFKDVLGWLVKAGWASKRPSSKSLDSSYKYFRPGGRHDGKEGDDYLLGELAVLRYVENMRVIEVAAEQANQTGVGRAVGQAVVTARHEYGTSEQEARSTSRAAGAVADGSEALGNTAAGVVAVARARERNKRGDRAERNALRAAASTFGTDGMPRNVAPVRWEKSVLVAVVLPTKKLFRGVEHEGVVHEDVVHEDVVREDVVLVVAVRVGRRHELQTLQPASTTITGATGATTPPIMLQAVYVNKLVVFSPDKQRQMKAKAYRPIGTAYIIGRVQFQGAVVHISVGEMQLGIKNYISLTRVKNPDWRVLVRPDPTDEIDFEEVELDEEEGVLEAFDPTELLPTSLAEVEAIRSMLFVPSGEVEVPSYLYQHSDGSTQTYLRPEFEHLFEHSTSSSFFDYIPLYFWRQVLHETKKYAVVNNIRLQMPFTLDELMNFLGIIFFMAMNDKGEHANYWGLQAEDLILVV